MNGRMNAESQARPGLQRGRPHSLGATLWSWAQSESTPNPSMTRALWLLLLLSLLWAPTGARTEKVAVLAPTEIYSFRGYTVTLPCSLRALDPNTTEVTQITWLRREPSGVRGLVAAFHPVRGPSVLEPDRVGFAAARRGGKNPLDASLTIRWLRPEDEANYTCQITSYPWGTESADTWLRLFYTPQVSISRSDDIGPQGHKETTLTCEALSNPEPKGYEWSTTSGPLPPSAVPQGARLLIRLSEEIINTTFVCRVSNALGTGQAAMRVLLPEPVSEEPQSNLLKISLLIGITIFLGIVALSMF